MARGFVRVPFVARVSVATADRTQKATILNLSPRGLYLETDSVPTGELTLRFHLPDGGPLVEAAATVAWICAPPPDARLATATGCGVRFSALPPDDARRILRLVDTFRLASGPLPGVEPPISGCLRAPFLAPCTLVGSFGIAQGATCNLSPLGLFVAVERSPDVGDAVHVEVDLPGFPERFERAGTITWRNPGAPESPYDLPAGCGVRLRNLSAEDLRLLGGLIDDSFAALPPAG